MGNKYCKKLHPTVVTNSGASHVWRKMIDIREEVEHDIWWQVKAGNSIFWLIIGINKGHYISLKMGMQMCKTWR
uniref:Putative ovule protein n=1 Tax=Solanum chacoense TaxID=4108 RepID=A0A0V0GP60_SOLCH